MLRKNLKIWLLYYGGKDPDLKDNENATQEIFEALKIKHYDVEVKQINEKNWMEIKKLDGDLFFNLVEDTDWSLYKKVGSFLETNGRIQVGHTMTNLKTTLDKMRMKRLLQDHKISTPKWRVVDTVSEADNIKKMNYPMIVKPANQHAGLGISQDSVVIDKLELKERVKYVLEKFGGEALIEEYVDGREIHVSVIGNDNKLTILPFCELTFKGEFSDNWEVYSYEAKWEEKSWEYWNVPVNAPAPVSKILDKRIRILVKKAFKALGAVDVVRFDLRIDEKEKPFIIDVNFNPSLGKDPYDATWVSAKAKGMTHAEMIQLVVRAASRRMFVHQQISL